MNRNTFRIALLAVCASAAMVVAGCSSGGTAGDESPAPSGSESSSPASASSSSSSISDSSPSPSKTTTVRIGLSSWLGFAPAHVAETKGFYKEHGVDVELVPIEDPTQRINSLKAGQIDAALTTPDTWAHVIPQGVDAVQVWAMDASTGGDGILADKSIASVADLAGKQVGVSQGSTSEFFLAYILAQNDMSLADVTEVNMTSDQAGAAFAAGQIDAAVTWEPWLTNAVKQNTNGHVLVSTEKYPTILADTLGFERGFLDDNKATAQAVVDALAEAAAFIESNPDEANQIIADANGISVDDLKGLLPTTHFFTSADNKKYFDPDADTGTLYTVFESASDFWKNAGIIDSMADASTVISAELVKNAS